MRLQRNVACLVDDVRRGVLGWNGRKCAFDVRRPGNRGLRHRLCQEERCVHLEIVGNYIPLLYWLPRWLSIGPGMRCEV